MLKAFTSGLLAAGLGIAALAITMWTLSPTTTPQSEVYTQRAQTGMVEHAAWIADLKVTQATVGAAHPEIVPGS